MFAVNPIFWFCGSTSVIYVLEALISIVIGHMPVALKSSSDLKTPGDCHLLRIFGRIPPDIHLYSSRWQFMLPAGKFDPVNHAWKLLLVFSCFDFPLVAANDYEYGWAEKLLADFRRIDGIWRPKNENPSFGGYASYLLNNLANFAVWLLQGLTPVGVGIMLYAVFKYWKKYFVRKTIHNERGNFHDFMDCSCGGSVSCSILKSRLSVNDHSGIAGFPDLVHLQDHNFRSGWKSNQSARQMGCFSV